MSERALIPAYFSHSYRATDRLVNEFFVDVLYRAGFTLTVDPKSAVLSPTQLEMMMRDSACFVGVVTQRPDERHYRCSPFAVYEYGLAIQARKPRLMFVEHGVSGRPFMQADLGHVFDREILSTFDVPHEALRRLAEAGVPYVRQAQRTLGEVGLILPTTPDFAEVLSSIELLLDDAGYTPVRLDLASSDAVTVAARLDRLDYVIVELSGQAHGAWILPYLMGRFIPSIRLLRHDADSPTAPTVPELARDQALERANPPRQHAIRWHDPLDLLGELALEINQLDRPRRRFRDADDGKAYLRSLDRANGPVFVSNAWADNSLAEELTRALQQYNIDFFHYQYRNTIPLAVSWQKRLLAKVDESRIFVALISHDYLESQWCQLEMQRAEELRRAGLLTVIPYFLDRSPGLGLPVQGRGLERLGPAEQVSQIVADLQQELEEEARLRHRPTALIAGDHRPVRPDIAIVACSLDHFQETRDRLTDPQTVVGTQLHPDRFSWTTGTVDSARKGRYRVVLALGDGQPGTAERAIRATVEAFEPGSIVLLADAADVGPRAFGADVVVADRLVGFECHGTRLVPRPGWTVPTDPAIATAARAVPRSTAKVLVGPAVCGNLTGPLTAELTAQIRAEWPEMAAVDPSRITAARALEACRSAHPRTEIVAVWTTAADGVDPRGSAAHGALLITQLVAGAWPRPPATDEPEGSDSGVDARTA